MVIISAEVHLRVRTHLFELADDVFVVFGGPFIFILLLLPSTRKHSPILPYSYSKRTEVDRCERCFGVGHCQEVAVEWTYFVMF